jgi:hypothetical protein
MSNGTLLVGWKEIMAAFGVRSLKTMKKKVKKYSIPVVGIARKPTIYLEQVKEWKVHGLKNDFTICPINSPFHFVLLNHR